MRLIPFSLCATFILGLLGCETIPEPSPLANEERPVRQVEDSQMTVTVHEQLSFFDDEEPARGIVLPAGTYELNAEDDEYYYFRAPDRLLYRVRLRTQMIEERDMPGGLMVRKTEARNVPAAAFLHGNETMRLLIWKLERPFMQLEGDKWSRSWSW